MPTLGTNVLTMADWAKGLDPNGEMAAVVELLSQTNDMLEDMVWREANGVTAHRTTVRTGLPQAVWRLFNQGVQPTRSTKAQIDEAIGMLEDWSEIDKDLAELGGDVAGMRMSEAMAHIEGMNQEMQQTMIFGNSSINPEEFTGLAVRYSDLSADIGQNIIDAGGTGSDNSSIWFVVWGENTVCGIFPKGSQFGLMHENLGLETAETTAGVGGARLRVYRDRWQWKTGLAVKDWRFAVRIANIDISNLVAQVSAADLVEEMIKAWHRIPNLRAGRPSIYMNRTTAEFLDIQRREDVITGGGLGFENVDGRRINTFRGIPIRIVDQLIETEAQVT